jgi:hypothetical protein
MVEVARQLQLGYRRAGLAERKTECRMQPFVYAVHHGALWRVIVGGRKCGGWRW